MSELIGEARVLVTPDTTKFAALLETQVLAAAKSVVVPVQVVPVAGGTSGISAVGDAAAVASRELAIADRISKQFQLTTVGIATSATEAAVALDAEATAAQAAAIGLSRSSVSSAQIARVNQQMAVTAAAFAKAQDSTITPLVASRRAATALAEAEKLLEITSQGAAVAQERLSRSLVASVAGFHESAVAANEAAAAQKRAAASSAQTAASMGGLAKGAGSAGASLLGVRGATLAATGPFIAGAAGAIAFGKAIGIATSFNSQLSVFAATTGATADQMERVSKASVQLGKDITLPGVSAGDAAEAMTEFAKAGLSVNDAIAAARGGLQLATAAQLSNAEAVEITASALNAFKLSGDQAVSVADTLANAANLAQGSISDIALGLRQASGAAAAVGVSFQDTTALLTLLAKNGLTASDAGTALRTAFIRLVNPSKKAQEILRDLNVNLRDAQGNLRPQVFQEFAAAQRDLAVSTQQANSAIVFGQDAFRVIGLLGREPVDALTRVQTGLEETGTAARIAGARMTGLRGATANLTNQLETFGNTVGQKAIPPLTILVDNLAGVVSGLNDAAGAAEAAASALSSFGGGQQEDPFRQVKDIGSFLVGTNIFNIKSQIQDLVDGPKEEIGSAGAELRSAIEDAARVAATGAVSFGDQITGALTDAFNLIDKTVAQAAKNFRAGQFASVARAGGQQSGLEEILNQIVAGGGSDQQQIANLRRQAAVQAKIISQAGPDAAGNLLKARRDAQEKLASINQQIVSIETRIAADQKATQDAAQRVRDQAKADRDRAFLQTQEDARTAAQRQVSLAEDTPGLRDDIRRQQQLHDLLQRQINGIKASALDEDAKQQALRVLRNARNQTTDEIKRLRDADKEQRQQQREQAQEEARQAAEALASARLELAQTTFDLTEQKGPLERALDAEIKRQIRIKNAAKKGSLAFIQAQTEIRRLLKEKKDLNEEVDQETTGGTSLVDLFNKAQDILGGAGNVGFNASSLSGLSATPRIQAEVQQRLDIVNDPAKAAAAKQVAATDRLILAIDQLTQVLTGNTASGTPVTRREQNQWRNLTQEQRFYNQRTARQMVEQGLVG